MASAYRRIFQAPGTIGFSSAAFFARLPFAMVPIGIVAMLSQTRGEYWLAGAVAATFALTNALVAPQISRLIDRRGQTPVVIPATSLSVAAFVTLILAAHQNGPSWVLFVSAFLSAFMPSMPAMVRARWTEVFRGRPELNTAFAFESALDELVYIAGASLSVGLAVALFPEAGMVTSTLMLAIGSIAFIAQRKTEPKVRAVEDSGPQGSAIRLRAVQIITAALIFVGATFATAEVTVVAITKALGAPNAATLIIGVYALGSFMLGLVLGAIHIKLPLQRQLLIAVSALALTALPLLIADTILLLTVAVFVSGIAISPTFITAIGLIERRVPASMLTEGVTWVMTGIGIGMALGAFVSGWVVDNFGAENGFWVSVASASITVVIVALGQCRLGDDSARPTNRNCVPQPAE
jgi:MFS family permease